eukprot:m.256773 g.256773  ORF g.256773 m.256773 type:complete len:372 (+) comp34681_c0_seq1:128-1243(+)
MTYSKRILACLSMVSVVSSASRFNCTVGTIPPPVTDIAKLHPGHVRYVMAMGDSITAAFAARATLLEARDASWSIGVGSDDQLTLPHLLEYYSPKVEGQSTKAVLPKDIAHMPHNDWHPETDHMNVAESEGAVHRGSMVEQWGFLSSQFSKYPDFDTEWKVLTVWMFANDVCGECKPNDPSPAYLDAWAAGYEALLTNVSSTMKNVYVNVISTLDLSNIARLQRSKEFCNVEHKYILKECGCIDRGNATELVKLDETVHLFNSRLHNITAEWYTKLRTMGREKDMAVVTQSFQEGIGKNLDISFLNNLDCFHPSTKAHEDLAIGLWNSMLCTDDRKNRCNETFTPNIQPTCPTVDSVFYTGPDVVPNPPSM